MKGDRKKRPTCPAGFSDDLASKIDKMELNSCGGLTMAMKVTRVDVWAATIKDRPGGLAEKLQALAEAKTNLGFVIARRMHDKPGKGVVFLNSPRGPGPGSGGEGTGLCQDKELHSVRVEGPDKPGLGPG